MTILTPHQLKALNTGISLSLTANAGSGKTFVLAKRYLEILLKTEIPISKIVAITFTEKAAGELYKKIASELEEQFNNATDPGIKKKINQIRKKLVSAKISTIHSFCLDLLKEFPVEASVDANFIPLDPQTANELIELSIEEVLKSNLSAADENTDVKLLIRLLGSRKILTGELSKLIWNRKIVQQLEKNIYEKPASDTANIFFELFKSELSKVFKIEMPQFAAHIKIINDRVLHNKPDNSTAIKTQEIIYKIIHQDSFGKNYEDVIEILKTLHALKENICTKAGSIKSKEYLPGDERGDIQISINSVEAFFYDIKDLIISENHHQIENELAKYGKAAIKVFKEVLSSYERRKNETASLDFEDLLIKTKELLTNEKIQTELRKKYEYLLVDEYQDTNEIQYQIFLPLVDYLKSGNLFIVGDEKQSIYRFREAELEVFGRTKFDIKNTAGNESLLSLPDSFRMSPAICLFTNYLFRNLFRNPQQFYNEVEHSDLVCARDDGFQGRIEFLISESAKDEEENFSSNIEAELISKRILLLREEQKGLVSEWNDIAVLVRKRSSFAELEKTFTKNKIPYTVVGGTGYYQKQSISDIYNYFAFLFNQKDDAALIGVLRSPFFSVSDMQIFLLSLFKEGSYWERLCTAAETKSVAANWIKVFEKLNENLNLVKRIDIPSLLRKILTETNFISIISSRPDGAQEIANLNKLISLTISFFNKTASSGKTLYDYLNFQRDAISKIEDEAQAGTVSENTGVNLVTIHQAKGLEFSAVFLYKCDDTTQSSSVKSKSFTINKNYGLLTKVPANEDFFSTYNSPLIVQLHNFIEKKKSLAELKRLLYVAVTRAKNFLFISSGETKNQSEYAHSFNNLIRQGLNTGFSQNYVIEDKLTFLIKANEDYVNETRRMRIEIPIVRDIVIKTDTEINGAEAGIILQQKRNLLDKIEDKSNGEFISATKFSVFADCPRKYNLIYNYHLDELLNKRESVLKEVLAKTNYYSGITQYMPNEPYVNKVEDEYYPVSNLSAGLKGKIIHKLLEKNLALDKISSFVNDEINKEFFKEKINEGDTDKFITEIKSIVDKFYNSDEHRFISLFSNYKNEFEAYLKEEDYFLYGIIDKLIIDHDKIIIVDYKTVNITETEINISAEKYLLQLKFYAYVISPLFPQISDIELRLIFITHPDKPIIFGYNQIFQTEIRNVLKSLISVIRSNNYSVNLKHCNHCHFSPDGRNCIIKNKF